MRMNETTTEEPDEQTPLVEPTIRIPSESPAGPAVWWIEPSNPELDPAAAPTPEPVSPDR